MPQELLTTTDGIGIGHGSSAAAAGQDAAAAAALAADRPPSRTGRLTRARSANANSAPVAAAAAGSAGADAGEITLSELQPMPPPDGSSAPTPDTRAAADAAVVAAGGDAAAVEGAAGSRKCWTPLWAQRSFSAQSAASQSAAASSQPGDIDPVKSGATRLAAAPDSGANPLADCTAEGAAAVQLPSGRAASGGSGGRGDGSDSFASVWGDMWPACSGGSGASGGASGIGGMTGDGVSLLKYSGTQPSPAGRRIGVKRVPFSRCCCWYLGIPTSDSTCIEFSRHCLGRSWVQAPRAAQQMC